MLCKKTNIALLLLLSFLPFLGFSQDIKQDLLKINQAYSAFSNISMDITYNLYASYNSMAPAESERGFFKQRGNQRYSKLREVESLQNHDKSIVVDNDDKLIVIANPVQLKTSKLTMIDLDKAMEQCNKIESVPSPKGIAAIKLTFKPTIASEYDAVEIYYNKKNYVIEKMVFYYRQKIKLNEDDVQFPAEKPKLEIVFSNISSKEIKENTLFSEERFVEKKKGKYYAANAYNNYEVIDQQFKK